MCFWMTLGYTVQMALQGMIIQKCKHGTPLSRTVSIILPNKVEQQHLPASSYPVSLPMPGVQ